MTPGEMEAPAATSSECELTIFAFSCVSFVVHQFSQRPAAVRKTLPPAAVCSFSQSLFYLVFRKMKLDLNREW